MIAMTLLFLFSGIGLLIALLAHMAGRIYRKMYISTLSEQQFIDFLDMSNKEQHQLVVEYAKHGE